MYSEILVALDQSKHAHAALEQAFDYASLNPHSHVTICSVFDPLKTSDPAFGVAARIAGVVYAGSSENDEARRARIEDMVAKLGKPGVKYRICLPSGRPAEQIVALAEDIQADIIMMGSRGLGALTATVLGSVSLAVLKDAPCSVLLIK